MNESSGDDASHEHDTAAGHSAERSAEAPASIPRWRRILGRSAAREEPANIDASIDEYDEKARPEKWSMGVLNDKKTEEVPGASYSIKAIPCDHPTGRAISDQEWLLLRQRS